MKTYHTLRWVFVLRYVHLGITVKEDCLSKVPLGTQ